MMGQRRAWTGLALVVAVGCEGRFGHGERDVVAWVGEEPIRQAELEAYLADNLLAVEEGGSVGETDPAVASRLLDALVDQKLLLLEAQRTGIEVTDVEIAVYVGETDEGSGHVAPTAVDEARARQRLMIEKLQEHVLRSLPAPTAEEVSAWAAGEGARLLPGRPVELRALQLPAFDVARNVREEVRRGRLSFEEAIVAHEPSPGQTVSTRVSRDDLPPDVRQAIEGLETGGISEPVELHGRVYLFEILSWHQDPDAVAAEMRVLARQEAQGNLLRELRKRTEVRIRTSNLPFSYTP